MLAQPNRLFASLSAGETPAVPVFTSQYLRPSVSVPESTLPLSATHSNRLAHLGNRPFQSNED
jgi:hypothetical protein